MDTEVLPPPPPTTLLTMPEELLTSFLSWLPPPAIAKLASVCRGLRDAAESNSLWEHLLSRFFPDRAIEPDTPWTFSSIFRSLAYDASRQQFNHMRTHRGGKPITQQSPLCPFCPCAPSCGGSLLQEDGQRCPCVVVRSPHLPLRLGQLDDARSGSSSLRSGGFTELLALLDAHFQNVNEHNHVRSGQLEFVFFPELAASALERVDVLVLCTTEGPALSPDELATLQRWVHAGGALIVSAFSNWSAHGHFAAATVGWLGLETIPGTVFMPECRWRLQPPPLGSPRGSLEVSRLCGNASPFAMRHFGTSWISCPEMRTSEDTIRDRMLNTPEPTTDSDGNFVNVGESVFRVPQRAFELGAVPLCAAPVPHPCLHTTLCFYPPGCEATQRGRVLVCSNLHWLCDRTYWLGGTLHKGDCARLLLNFLAGAIAARVPPPLGAARSED